jgi:hypothetical protein
MNIGMPIITQFHFAACIWRRTRGKRRKLPEALLQRQARSSSQSAATGRQGCKKQGERCAPGKGEMWTVVAEPTAELFHETVRIPWNGNTLSSNRNFVLEEKLLSCRNRNQQPFDYLETRHLGWNA